MQYVLDMENETDRLRVIDSRLRGHFKGYPPRYLILDPVSQLVMSLLGGQTRSDVSRAAHLNLWARYGGRWSEVRDAGAPAVEALICDVTHAERKAKYIVGILGAISDDRGEPNLDHLRPMSVQAAHQFLENLTGVGPKVAAAVLNTSTLRKRSLVIDTHHLRILERVGFLKSGADFPRAYRQIMPLMPSDWNAVQLDVHRMLFKRLGQTLCRPTWPSCPACPLSDICAFAGFSQKGRDPVREAA